MFCTMQVLVLITCARASHFLCNGVTLSVVLAQPCHNKRRSDAFFKCHGQDHFHLIKLRRAASFQCYLVLTMCSTVLYICV